MTLPDPNDPMGPAAAAVLAAWLNEQPAGAALTWGDAHQWLAPGVHAASWVDVTVPAACEQLRTSWTWTVVSPTDDDARDAWPTRPSVMIALQPDVAVAVAVDPSTGWYDETGPRAVYPAGGQPEPAALEEVACRAAELDGTVVHVPGWSEAAINEALTVWTGAVSGRTDVTFTRDPQWQPEWVTAVLDRDPAEPTIDLGDGLRASDAVMDRLLEIGPDAAAEVTEELKMVIRALRRDPDGRSDDGYDPYVPR